MTTFRLTLTILIASSLPLIAAETKSSVAASGSQINIAQQGAIGDGSVVNTKSIQHVIDGLSERGGGTVVIPRGVFVSGALFFKPKVNLHLEKDAVLQCSTDMENFPSQRTWIEGHYEEKFTPALVNANGCDGFQITGEGTLDGAGRPIWDKFWKAIKADKNFKNLDMLRARLAIIEGSKNVKIEGVTLKNSQYWHLHLFRCQNVVVKNVRFEVPDDYKQAPSSDGIDVDSSQDVTIESCYFSVTDDCIAMKGAKGPDALGHTDVHPVERVRINNCEFRRGHYAVSFGSEATTVRSVVIENSRVTGAMPMLNFKLRPDTPQTYQDIQLRNITFDSTGAILFTVRPWKQYFDLKGQKPPQSTVSNITISNITGRLKSLGEIRGNPGQTTIHDIAFRDIKVEVSDEKLKTAEVKNLTFENVAVNGKNLTAPSSK